MELFKPRGQISKKAAVFIELSGFIIILTTWSIITGSHILPSSILPAPWKVLSSFKELHFEDALVRNMLYSLQLNILGYVYAVVAALLIGFPTGLFPFFRSLFSRYIESSRYLPITALTGIFIAWFGIETNMKVMFLAFGIFVYLLPVVIQRIDEVEEVYVQTARTLGATRFQYIVTVFIPAVMQRISDDIRVLVAISWTYIIVAELVNRTGGLGSMAFAAARQSRMDKVFAVLLVIVLIGFIQDRVFRLGDKLLFPHKYERK